MKNALFSLLAFIVMGCTPTTHEQANVKISTKVTDAPVASPSNYRFCTITIDGCEYIMYDHRMIVHKGNCKFCEHRRKAEMERLFNKINIK